MNTFGQNFNLSKVLKETDYTKRKTKIICTLGPESNSVELICKLLDAGMNVARLTYCHSLKQGPDIRTSLLKDDKPIELKKGQKLEILNDEPEYLGDENIIGCSYNLSSVAKIGQPVLLQDNTIYSHVIEVKESGVVVQIENEGVLKEVKNVRLPGVKIDLPTISEEGTRIFTNKSQMKNLLFLKDQRKVQISYLFLLLEKEKIQNMQEIYYHLEENTLKLLQKLKILKVQKILKIFLKVVMVLWLQGDLGKEIPTQKVFVAQKWMIDRCLEVGKPVITATQMMESMVRNPRPTRAEASDVANAVLDGTDAVMLSTETSIGEYPVECVEIMSQIAREAEMCYNNAENFFQRTKMVREISDTESMATSAVQMSFDLKAPIIVVFTMYGEMARLIAKYRPSAHIIVVSNEPGTIKALTISNGIISLKVPSFQGIEKLIDYAINRAKELNLCQKGQKVIVVMGSEEEDQDQSDILKVKTVC